MCSNFLSLSVCRCQSHSWIADLQLQILQSRKCLWHSCCKVESVSEGHGMFTWDCRSCYQSMHHSSQLPLYLAPNWAGNVHPCQLHRFWWCTRRMEKSDSYGDTNLLNTGRLSANRSSLLDVLCGAASQITFRLIRIDLSNRTLSFNVAHYLRVMWDNFLAIC